MSNTNSFFIPPADTHGTVLGGTITQLIESLKDFLVANGWTLVGATTAGGWLSVPGWFIIYDPTEFNDPITGAWYQTINDGGIGSGGGIGCRACVPDRGGETPVFTFNANPCRNGFWHGNVDCNGVTWTDTLICDGDGNIISGSVAHHGEFTGDFQAFAIALTGCGSNYSSNVNGFDRDGTPISDITFEVYVTANHSGPKYNSPKFRTNFGVGLYDGSPALGIAGGGYRLRSQAANGHTQYELLITQYRQPVVETIPPGNAGGGGNGQLSIRIKELNTNSEVEYQLQVLSYNVFANPYTLCMFSGTTDQQGVFFAGGNSILITAPYNQNPNIDYCLIVIGPGGLIETTTWTPGLQSFAINGAFTTGPPQVNAGGTCWPGLMCRPFITDGPVLTTSGKPLAQTAFVMGAPVNEDEATVIGVLWDSFVLSKTYPKGSRFNVNGVGYTQVSAQESPMECSMWMRDGQEIG